MRDSGDENADSKWNDFAENISEKLNNIAVNIYSWKYSLEIAMRTVFMQGEKVENQVENYIFTSDNYKCIKGLGE